VPIDDRPAVAIDSERAAITARQRRRPATGLGAAGRVGGTHRVPWSLHGMRRRELPRAAECRLVASVRRRRDGRLSWGSPYDRQRPRGQGGAIERINGADADAGRDQRVRVELAPADTLAGLKVPVTPAGSPRSRVRLAGRCHRSWL
jgi:hypothetical protein